MRKRNIKLNVFIDAKEKQTLDSKVNKSGVSKSEFIRKVIADYQLKEQPDERFYEILKQLRGIANNLNQMAKIYNANSGYVYDYQINPILNDVRDLVLDLQNKYLLPEKKGVTDGNNKTMEVQ